jgi:peptide/nickel transport system substrate-binding protein
VVVVVLAAVMGWSGCGTITGGDAVVVAVESQPRSLDPRLGSVDSVSARVHQIVFDSLVRKNERFEFSGHLAESYEASPDARVYTFKLRPGVKTHTGRDLTSSDVKFTYESIRSPELKSPVAAAFNRIEAIETPDPLTVVFRCREPYYQLLGDLVAIPVMVETPTGSPLMGTGPFKIVDSSEQWVELEAHEGYFLGAPNVKKLRVRVVTDNNTRELELKSGGVDFAINTGFAPDAVSKMKTDPELQVIEAPGTNIAHMGLNVNDEALRNPKVRQALAFAINRDQIIQTLLQGQGRPADAIMPPESWAYAEGLAQYTYDPARAKQLLDEAGLRDPDGDGPATRFDLEFVTSNSGIAPAMSQIVQEQWRQIGVNVTPSQFERVTYFDRIAQGNFDAYFIISVGANQTPDVFSWAYFANYWAPDRGELDAAATAVKAAADPAAAQPDMQKMLDILGRKGYCPTPEVDRLLTEARGAATPADRRERLLAAYDMLTSRGAGNRARYCNPTLNEKIIQAERSTSRDEQRALYGDIQRAVSQDEPYIYLYYTDNVIVASKRVGNIQIDPSGSWYFLKDVTVSE